MYLALRITRPLTLRQRRLVDGGNGNQNSIVCSMPRLSNKTSDAEIGRQLRKLRIERRISQTALGLMINVTYQQVQKYEKGSNGFSVSTMKMIAAALDVKPCEICGCCDE